MCVCLSLQVASREHRRLKKSSEQHPGYAMSRAYLETLADLPWNTFSGQAAPDKPDMVKNARGTSTGSSNPTLQQFISAATALPQSLHRSASYMWAGHMHPICLLLTYDWVTSPSGALSLRLLACADALNASHKVLLCRGFLGCRFHGNQHKQRGRSHCCIHRHCTTNTVKTCTTIFTSRSS